MQKIDKSHNAMSEMIKRNHEIYHTITIAYVKSLRMFIFYSFILKYKLKKFLLLFVLHEDKLYLDFDLHFIFYIPHKFYPNNTADAVPPQWNICS